MAILATKLKNAIENSCKAKGVAADKILEFKIKNIRINGATVGCSGFIHNKVNGTVVYVTTESAGSVGLMYRYAKSMTDYRGGRNRFARTLEEYVCGIEQCLSRTPMQAGERF